jgi:hypothetical protein
MKKPSDSSDPGVVVAQSSDITDQNALRRKPSWRHAFSAKWRLRLNEELSFGTQFKGWSSDKWRNYLTKRRVLSDNYDTVVSLDWPHFCSGATEGCGGDHGWCYTLGGQLGGSSKRSSRAAITDRLARDYPKLFSEIVGGEVDQLVKSGRLPYPNLRFSGSGEIHNSHLPALIALTERGIHLWGFSRNLRVATRLREAGIAVLFSSDSTTPEQTVVEALRSGLKLAYTSTGVDDHPPLDTFVVFPLHRSGSVREVVDSPGVCPKVLEEYLEGRRRRAACQFHCKRCHMVRS